VFGVAGRTVRKQMDGVDCEACDKASESRSYANFS
jgi:hypothetical protein